MPYGPSDIITDGVDGYLIPNGDIDALAERIATIVAASPEELAPLREAGYRRALDFSDERVLQLWSSTLADVAGRRGF
jgi:poly(glycerol-phosphate) alpha-glucosyltransferase